MKGISTIIATIVFVVITIALVSTAYLFFGGLLTSWTSKTIDIIHAKGHSITIRNLGTDTIDADEIKVIVNDEEVEIIDPEAIEAGKSKVLKFIPPDFGTELRSAKVFVIGPSNSLSYTTDIIPHAPKPTADTVGLWHFNSVNATNHTLDESSYHNDGLLKNFNTNPLTLSTSKFGNCPNFDGTDDYVEVQSDSSLDVQIFTVEAWIKPYNNTQLTTRLPGLINRYGPTIDDIFLMRAGICADSDFGGRGISCEWQSSTQTNWWTTHYPFVEGEWYHVACVVNETNRTIYVNSVIVNQTFRGIDLDYSNPGSLFIGQEQDGTPSEFFNGTIDEVKIYNTALTHLEILDSVYG